jgi:hypothetical protein
MWISWERLLVWVIAPTAFWVGVFVLLARCAHHV